MSNGDEDTRWGIREAHATDLQQVRALLGECELPVDDLVPVFGDAFIVAARDRQLIGVAGVEVHGPYGLLRSVAVLPSARGRGVGAALVEDRLRWSVRKSLRAVYLLTDTVPEFFERFGFRVVARERVPAPVRQSREYASICPADATVMELALPGSERG